MVKLRLLRRDIPRYTKRKPGISDVDNVHNDEAGKERQGQQHQQWMTYALL